jgi:hypothetical protein
LYKNKYLPNRSLALLVTWRLLFLRSERERHENVRASQLHNRQPAGFSKIHGAKMNSPAGGVRLECAGFLPHVQWKFSQLSVRQRVAAFTNWFHA